MVLQAYRDGDLLYNGNDYKAVMHWKHTAKKVRRFQARTSHSWKKSNSGFRRRQNYLQIITQLQRKEIEPWKIGKSSNDEVRLEFYDETRSVPKYAVIVNSALEFSVFAFNWLVPDKNFV